MTPIGGRILVKVTPEDKSEKMAGAIILPADAKLEKPPRKGIAWGIGPDCKQVEIHDELILPAYLAHEFHYLGYSCALLHEDEVLGVM